MNGRTLTACACLLAAMHAHAQSIDSYAPQPNGTATTVAMQADGKMLIGGPFLQIGTTPRMRLARIDVDGNLDPTFGDPGIDSEVKAIAVQADGRILVGGGFTHVGGQPRHYLARLNDDGTLDTAFADPQLDGTVWSIALQPDGRILAGGDFSHVGAVARGYAARIEANGTLDTSFSDPLLNTVARAVAVQADGRVLIGGAFSHVGATQHFYLARFSAAGAFEPSFPNVSDSIVLFANDIAVAPDGSIFLTNPSTPALRKLHADGTLDAAFNAVNADGTPDSVVLQPDGKLLIAGTFQTVGGQARANVARLNANGSLDATFGNVPFRATAVDPNAYAYGLAMQADGAVVVIGNFTLVGQAPRQYVARIGATQRTVSRFSAAAAGASVQATWMRSGGGEEVVLPPTLQYSSDGTHFTDVVAMTRIAGGWSASAPHDVHGTPFWLRALGTFSSGANNGSQTRIASPTWFSDTIFADGFD